MTALDAINRRMGRDTVFYAGSGIKRDWAAFAVESATADMLILKVDVDEDRLYPDDDFVAWALTSGIQGVRQAEMNPYIDPRSYKDMWRLSPEHNGVVCTPEVSPGAHS